ncbi:hypothetical protein LOAG_02544, partial [Loa loa]
MAVIGRNSAEVSRFRINDLQRACIFDFLFTQKVSWTSHLRTVIKKSVIQVPHVSFLFSHPTPVLADIASKNKGTIIPFVESQTSLFYMLMSSYGSDNKEPYTNRRSIRMLIVVIIKTTQGLSHLRKRRVLSPNSFCKCVIE